MASSRCEKSRPVEMDLLRSLLVALQGREIALGQAQLARLEQPAHDLAAARLGQVGAEVDLLGRHRGAEALAGMAEQVAAQRLVGP